MKTKKMSLANIQGKLSRAEMKNIMAGSGDRVACMECGGSVGTLCEAAPPGGACIANDYYMVIQCTTDIEGGTVSFSYCPD